MNLVWLKSREGLPKVRALLDYLRPSSQSLNQEGGQPGLAGGVLTLQTCRMGRGMNFLECPTNLGVNLRGIQAGMPEYGTTHRENRADGT